MKRITLAEYGALHPEAVIRPSLLDAPRLDLCDKNHAHNLDGELLVVSIPDAIVYPDFFVASPDGWLIDDVGHQESLDTTLAWRGEAESSAVEVFVNGGNGNYYHWLLNWLPRLFLYEISNLSCSILVRSGQLAFHRDTWSTLFPCLGTKQVPLLAPTRFRKVHLPVFFRNPRHSPFAIRTLRSRTLAAVPPAQGMFSDHVYITRRNASKRRILNEEELVTKLAHFGFVPYSLEDMRFADQVRLFRGAKKIIAPHGAGLANLAFSSHGVDVVEIRNEHYTKVFWSLASLVGARGYRHFQGIASGEAPKPIHRDILVDVDRFAHECLTS